ncbi:methyl-accepting chemotaxis protein [Haloarcula montana]|uniref:methyl-accepting chemotaxis protein n=1 Tax=Haloarcula montana TaxID=3111776 RepID=UPI002D7945E5|nr:methyl-accepting chemotaxis protein [Haloarcula sp. GH36]
MSGQNTGLSALVPDRIRGSYFLKFAIATGLVLLAIGLIGYGVQAQTSETLREDVQTSLTQQTVSEAGSLSEFIESRRGPARFISDAPVFENGSNAEIRSYLQEQRESKLSGSVTGIHYIDTREERIVASTASGRAGEDISDVSWYGSYAFGDFDDVIVSEPYEGPDGRTQIAFISPVNGVFNGGLVVTYTADEVGTRFQSPISGTFTRVVDSSGKVLFANENATTLQPYLDDENATSVAVARGSEGEAGFVSDPAIDSQQSQNLVVSYAPVAGTDWVVLKHVPAANAYQLARNVGNGVLLLVGVALVGVVAIGATIGRNTAIAVRELSDRASAIEQGEYDVTLSSGRIDDVGQLFDSIAGMRDSLVDRIEEAERAVEEADEARTTAEEAKASAEQAREEAEALSEQLEATASEYGDVMTACAGGDLSRRLDTDAQSEAMRDIAVSFNAMLEEWEETIVSIQTFTDTVEGASQESATSVREIESASQDVSESAQRITESTQEQREQVERVSSEMSDLSATVEEITSTAETVAATSEETARTGEEGQSAATEAVDELDAIRNQTERAIASVEQLDEQMAAIGEVAQVIGDIAEETNMLALNANIEAARAGDGSGSGEGFAVVADEVKALAEETKESAEQIGSLIEEVTEQTEQTVDEMQDVGERVDSGSETVESALDALDTIAEQARETNAGVQEISQATDEQADAAQQVASMTDEVADIADETSAETERVAAAAEEQAAQVQEVSQRIEALSDQVAELRTELDAFETSDAATTSVTPASADGGYPDERTD